MTTKYSSLKMKNFKVVYSNNQSVKQSVNQSIDQSMNQSNSPVYQSI